jgi:hypothetical protein
MARHGPEAGTGEPPLCILIRAQDSHGPAHERTIAVMVGHCPRLSKRLGTGAQSDSAL